MQRNRELSWQASLQEAFSNIGELLKFLELEPWQIKDLLLTQAEFVMKIPRGYAACMEKGNPDDPLLKQVLPLSLELQQQSGYSRDPVGDLAASPQSGIIHKYQGRALFIVTGACAVNCRYCFRRNFPYADMSLNNSDIDGALGYLKQSDDITEIILSGGDPLLLSDARFKALVEHLSALESIRRIRIHSRVPVVLPERITPEFAAILAESSKRIVMVVHANHPNELSSQVAVACKRLQQNNVSLLNQSVLLKGINDQFETLVALSEKLFEIGVYPYYLHTLDRALGTAHFEVEGSLALELHRALQVALPGYLVPKLVKEEAGAAHKILLHA